MTARPRGLRAGRRGNAKAAIPGMNGRLESDCRLGVLASPPSNAAAAEAGEERERIMGNTAGEARPGRSAGPGVSSGLDRVREVAKKGQGGTVHRAAAPCQ